MTTQVVLATGNQGKVREMSKILSVFNFELVPQSDFDIPPAEETGLTFIENAIIKARHASKHTGLPAIADDSGLSVDALNGAPGIYSARYAGKQASDRDNYLKLLEDMQAIPTQHRSARFHCTMVYLCYEDHPVPVVCNGSWQGSITDEVMGEEGFGYDPVFWVPDMECTAAQLTSVQKNKRSHRGKALMQLVQQMDCCKL